MQMLTLRHHPHFLIAQCQECGIGEPASLIAQSSLSHGLQRRDHCRICQQRLSRRLVHSQLSQYINPLAPRATCANAWKVSRDDGRTM